MPSNAEQRKQYKAEYYQQNRAKILAKCAEYAANNPEKIRQRNREQYTKNRAERLRYQKEYQTAHPEETREKVKKYQERNPEKVKAWKAARNERQREEYNRMKEGFGCLNPECQWKGKYTACMLDFHHIDPDTKTKPVSQLAHRPKVMWQEIAKCTCICSNCHRLVTYGELDGSQLPVCKIRE